MNNEVMPPNPVPSSTLEEIFDDMSSPIAEWNACGETLYANNAFCSITGLAWKDLIGRSFYKVVFPGRLEAQWDGVRDDFARLKPVANHITELYDRKGGVRAISWTIVLKRNASGDLASILGFGLDVTSFAFAQRELRYLANVLATTNGFIAPPSTTRPT